jgi:hypothetical protein
MRCKAKSKQRQAQCKLSAVPGMEVCRFHGGKTPVGPGSATYKDGRRSKFLPSRMFADYQAAGIDPELMSLRNDLALIDARIIDVLKRVDSGEAGIIWQAAQATMARFDHAWQQKDGHGMEAAIEEMRRLVGQGVSDWQAWREVGKLIEARRKLVEGEARRLATAHEMMSKDQCLALVGRVVDILRRHIPDRTILGAIAVDMQAMLHRGNGHADTDITPFAC